MLHPRIISQMEMKILRLLKSRSDNVRGEEDEVTVVVMEDEDDGKRYKRKTKVEMMTQSAMALPTLRIPFIVL